MPSSTTEPSGSRRVSLLTLGCARNEVDSEELAGRLAAGGWELAAEPELDLSQPNDSAATKDSANSERWIIIR